MIDIDELLLENEGILDLTEGEKDRYSFLHKTPRLIPLFKRIDSDNIHLDELKNLYKSILNSRATIKGLNIDIINIDSYDELLDTLDIIYLEEKTNKFVKLLPNKLREQFKQGTKLRIHFSEIISELDYKYYKLLVTVTNKYLDQPLQFLDFLKKEVSKRLPGVDDLLDILSDNSLVSDIVYFSGGYLVARIYTYALSHKIGSSRWCISYSNTSWEQYVNGISVPVKTDGRKGVTYFIWDFNIEKTIPESLIGVTVYDKKIICGNNRDNSAVLLSYVKSHDYFAALIDFNQLSELERIRFIVYNKLKYDLDKIPRERHIEYIRKTPYLLVLLDNKYIDIFSIDDIKKFVSQDLELLKHAPILHKLDRRFIKKVILDNKFILRDRSFNKIKYIMSAIDYMDDEELLSLVIEDKNNLELILYYDGDMNSRTNLIFDIIKNDPLVLVNTPNIWKSEVYGGIMTDKLYNWLKSALNVDRVNDYISHIEYNIKEKSSRMVDAIFFLRSFIRSDELIDKLDKNYLYLFLLNTTSKIGDLIFIDSDLVSIDNFRDTTNKDYSSLRLKANFSNNLKLSRVYIPKNLFPNIGHTLSSYHFYDLNQNEYIDKYIELIKYINEHYEILTKKK